MKNKGKFIVFEGVDGAGKTTMLKRAKKFLIASGIKTKTRKVPTEKAKDILDNFSLGGADTDQYIYLADLVGSMTLINWYKENGSTLLFDRFVPSNYVYSLDSLLPHEHQRSKDITDLVMQRCMPDKIFLFDVDLKTQVERLKKKKEWDEFYEDHDEDSYFMEGVFNGLREKIDAYRQLASEKPDLYTIIDANKDVDEVWQQVKAELEKIFNLK